MKLADLPKKQLGESKQDGGIDAAFRQVVNDLFDVSRQTFIFGGPHNEVSFTVNSEIIRSPIFDAVDFAGLLDDSAQCAVLRYKADYPFLMNNKTTSLIKIYQKTNTLTTESF